MEQQFRELYNLINTPDGNAIQTATDQLLALYNNPESIFPLIILMNPNEELRLRKAATIGLKATLQICWDKISNSEHLQGLKDNMIQFLSSEQDYTMRHILLDAMIPIFSTECENWPQLLQYIESLANATDEASIELFLSIFTTILRYLSINFVGSLFENLLLKAKTALSTQSIPVILAGSNLLRAILTLISTEKEIIISVVMDMLNAFYLLLKNNSPIAGEVLNDICLIFTQNTNFFDNIEPLLQQYFTIITDNSIPIENRCVCTEFLCTLIKQYPKELEAQSAHIISITLEFASLIVVDDCFESQLDLIYAVRPIEQLSLRTSPIDFFANFWESVQIDTPNKLVSTAAAINLFIENIPEIIAMNFSDIFDFAIECVQNPCHFVQESGFSIIFQLVSRYYLLFSDLFDKLMRVILPILHNSDHEPLICAALSILIELLYLIEIPDSFIEPLLASYIPLIQKVSNTSKYLVINAITSLIYSSQESIRQQEVAPNLIQILQEASSHDPAQHPLIVASGIEALSYLISFSPSETAPIHQFTLEKIHVYLQFEDASLFSSIMLSLRSLASQFIEFINNINPQILFGSIIKFLQFDLQKLGPETAVYSAFMEAKETSLLLISTLAKMKPEIIVPVISEIAKLVINNFNTAIEEYHTLKASLKATLAVAQILSGNKEQIENFKGYINKLIEVLVGNFESRSSETVSLSFYGFSRLISLNLQLNESILKTVINSAFNALQMSLNCQQMNDNFNEEEEEADGEINMNIELSDEVFGFFATLAQSMPANFPLEEFFNFTQQIFEKWKKGEIKVESIGLLIECIGVLCELFDVSSSSFPSLFKIALRQWFFESLKLCVDFKYPPHPLAAVRCYIEGSDTIKQEELNAIAQTAETVFSTEFQGQTYYTNTISSVLSLLFSVVRIVISARENGNAVEFDFQRFIPKMLALLPKNICQTEVNNILMSIVWCSRKINGFVEANGSEVLRILSLILGMKKKNLKKLKIQQETLNQTIQLWSEIRQAVPQADQLIGGWLDKFAMARFQERISPPQ